MDKLDKLLGCLAASAGAFLLFLACISIFAYPAFLMLCWNYFMPPVFGLVHIGYWQAFVLRLGFCFLLPVNSGMNIFHTLKTKPTLKLRESPR